MSKKAFVAVYKSEAQRRRRLLEREDFHIPSSHREFPFDAGDDPSFLMNLLGKGPVTWGVCRRSVRNQLELGDLVAFIAYCFDSAREEGGDYRFVGLFQVKTKVNQPQIFAEESLAPFREYKNLLIRPHPQDNRCFVHYEPLAPTEHKDWIWRMCESVSADVWKSELVDMEESGKWSPGQEAVADVRLANNYIIFEALRQLETPSVLARRDGDKEEWLGNDFAREMERLLLRDTGRSVRVKNSIAHPHIRHVFDSEAEFQQWKGSVLDLTKRNDASM